MKKIRLIIGVLLLSVGIGVFLYPNVREYRTSVQVDSIINHFEKTFDDSNDTQYQALHDEMVRYNQDLADNGQVITDAWDYEQAPVSLQNMPDKTPVIGYIQIDKIDLKMPLLLGASLKNMSEGATVMSQTSLPIGGNNTNCVIAAHRGYRGSAYFHYIDQLEPGDVIRVTNPWETLTYRVTYNEVVSATNTDVIRIQPDKDMITLISCHPYRIGGSNKQRIVVHAERTLDDKDISVPEKSDKRSLVKDSDAVTNIESYLRYGLPVITLLLGLLLIFIKRR